jgi:purine nucleosidase
LTIDSNFASLARELIFMGASLNPATDYSEFAETPRHEFNFWFDPEAAYVVLRAPWKRIVCTPTDVSIKTRLKPAMVKRMEASGTAIGRYIARYFIQGDGFDYMWDELAAAAWMDPYMSVNIDHGAGYGDTLTWTSKDDVKVTTQPVDIQLDVDNEKFDEMFVRLMCAPTPAAH